MLAGTDRPAQPTTSLELAAVYVLSDSTAKRVATELTATDPLRAHLSAELNIDQDDVVSPWHAALALAAAFTIGALLPLATFLLAPPQIQLVLTVLAVVVALGITGWTAAGIGGARPLRAVVRTLVSDVLALAATYLIGTLLGTAVG